MSMAYLAIDTICNENCRYCPCPETEKKSGEYSSYDEIKDSIDRFKEKGIADVTISGGEPTLHPSFLDIVSYAKELGMCLTILSNGERFSEKGFEDRFVKASKGEGVRVITTLHGGNKEKHEAANGTPGSFDRSVEGLKRLCEDGIPVTVKHCITVENYNELPDFCSFCMAAFPDPADIQLCGIDYCGIPEDMLEKERLPFPKIKKQVEAFFDLYEDECRRNGRKTRIHCINIPLCSCDPYYWKYLIRTKKSGYSAYKDPRSAKIKSAADISGTDERFCDGCTVKSLCPGTYRSAFEKYGDSIVKPIH